MIKANAFSPDFQAALKRTLKFRTATTEKSRSARGKKQQYIIARAHYSSGSSVKWLAGNDDNDDAVAARFRG